jgi:Predicted membrane protein
VNLLKALSAADIAALALFAVIWLAYEPLLKVLARGRGLINTDMTVIRAAWMQTMAGRENKLMDGQLLGHTINTASFFASSNLILIAGAAGVLFGGEGAFRSASSLMVLKTSSRLLFEAQIALVLLTLARGLLDFIWAIRQMNYCLAVIGAARDTDDGPYRKAYGAAASQLLNPALSSFNRGVRGYYFALAAAAWLFGAVAFAVATLAAVALLFTRQRHSPAAKAIADLRRLLEQDPAKDRARPSPSE